MHIAVVGSINTDITIKVPRFSRRNETVVGTGDYVVSQGGKGANQAAAAAAAGVEVYMIGKVGADDFGLRAVENLNSLGVKCDFVGRSRDHATGLATILVDDNGDNSITVAPGANARLSKSDVDAARDIVAGAHIVLMQLEVPLAVVEHAVRAAKKEGVLVLLDPAPAPAAPLAFLADVDFVTPNEVEAEAMTGKDANGRPEDIARALLQSGVKHVVLTLGARGTFIATRDSETYIEPYRVTAVDTTGAGDVFAGYFAASLAKGMGFPEAADVGSAAAALSVTRPGARAHLPTWREVEAFKRQRRAPR